MIMIRTRCDAASAILVLAIVVTTSLVASPAAVAADLTVVVDGVQSTKGTVVIELDDSAAAWDDKASAVATGKVGAREGSVVYVFRGLKPGTYAVGVFHDENGNCKLDVNFLGIPKEAWGISNNPKGLRKADFNEASFTVASENLTIPIHLVLVSWVI
jgi:uncharacterized protein (DUF2141 family)